MAKLIYSAIMSLDGYIADRDGNFQWAAPDEEVFSFVNDLERPIGSYLYGRRMYETMAVWETMDVTGEPPVMRDFADLWRKAEKIVFSTTLEQVATPSTRLVRSFDANAVRDLLDRAQDDISIGGAQLSGQAIRAGLVDEYQLFLTPVVVGGGTRALPDDALVDLDLVDERRFRGGVVYLHYRTRA